MEKRETGQLLASLGTNKTDIFVSMAKGTAGAIPFVGPIAAELIGISVPKQRMDRVIDCLCHFEEKVKSLEIDLQSLMTKEENIDLFEEGMVQASRAMSKERRQHIASILKNSLTRQDLEHVEKKHVFSLFSQINDAEAVILQWYGTHPTLGTNDEFYDKHRDVLEKPIVLSTSTDGERERAAIFDSYTQQLTDFGLLRPKFKTPRRGEFPEFDPQTGRMKATGFQITSLGRLLLRYMDAE